MYVCKLLCKRCILTPMYADTIFVYVYKYICFYVVHICYALYICYVCAYIHTYTCAYISQ